MYDNFVSCNFTEVIDGSSSVSVESLGFSCQKFHLFKLGLGVSDSFVMSFDFLIS